MNAEKLRSVLSTVAGDLVVHKTAALVQTLITQMQASFATPNEQTSAQVRTTIEALKVAAFDSAANDFTASERAILKDVGGADCIGIALFKRVETVLNSSIATPGSALAALAAIQTELTSFEQNVNLVATGFEKLGIEQAELSDGENTLGYTFPSTEGQRDLSSVTRELERLYDLLRNLGELVEDKETVRIKYVSSSDLLVVLLVGIGLLTALVKIADKISVVFKNVAETRRIYHDMEAAQVPEDIRSKMKEHADNQIKNGTVQIAEELVTEDYKGSDPGRRNELRNGLSMSLGFLAEQLDKGAVLEFKIHVPSKPKADSADPDGKGERYQRELKAHKERKELAERASASSLQLEQAKSGSERILFLESPEKPQNGQVVEAGASGPANEKGSNDEKLAT